MDIGAGTCEFRDVSQQGHRLAAAEDWAALIAFCREVMACRRLRTCDSGDCCTIFAASLLLEAGRRAGDDWPG